MRKIITDIKFTLIQFCRSRQSLFFAFVFPLMFLVLAWYLFGSASSVTLYYVDCDGSATSMAFLESLNSTGAVTLIDGSGQALTGLIRDGRISAYLEIPPGFEQSLSEARGGNGTIGLTLYYDRSNAATQSVVSVVQQAIDKLNSGTNVTAQPIASGSGQVTSAGGFYLDFLLPGILGIAIMGSTLDLTVGFIANYRATGVLRKLAVTPLSRIEWNLSRVVTGTIVALASVIVSLIIGWVAFGVHPAINVIMLLLVISGSVMFVGLGMLIAYVLKDGDAASAASFTITLPLILVSGSLFPVQHLPEFLQTITSISPLTYLINGLRSAMVTGDMADATANLAIVAVLGVVLFGLGIAALKWKDS
jgi:ABC-2 type transport system permease protein